MVPCARRSEHTPIIRVTAADSRRERGRERERRGREMNETKRKGISERDRERV